MSAGLPSRDSMSKTPQDFGMYTTQNLVARVVVSKTEKGMPSKESWEGVEKNVHDKLEQAGILTPDGALVAVGKMGKGVLLFFLLPTYFVLFTAPKWIAEEFIPLLGEKLIPIFESSMKFFQNLGLDPLIKSAAFLKKKFEEFKEGVVKQMTQVARAIQEKGMPLKEKAKEMGVKLGKNLMRPFQMVEKFITKTIEKSSSFQQSLNPIAEKMEKSFEKLRVIGEKVLNSVKNQLSKGSKIFEKGSKVISNVSQKIEQKAVDFFSSVHSFGLKLTSPFSKAFKATLSFAEKILKKTTPFIEKLVKRATKLKASFEKGLKKIESFFSPTLFEAIPFQQTLITIWMGLMTPLNWVNSFKTPLIQRLKNFSDKIVVMKKRVVEMFKFLGEFLKEKAQTAFKFFLKWGLKALKKGKEALSYLKIVLAFLMRGLKWLLYCIRIFFAVIHVLSSYVFQQLVISKK